ncbi:MAG: hypothetical protein LKF42_03005 [Streptococcaceae bacterium]|jgi:hypothetical protein|nr:hypothetical protein [Streptococcaceae bacterium]MCH4177343.1 hypothetical protein [Streptococcaceae bacterium]
MKNSEWIQKKNLPLANSFWNVLYRIRKANLFEKIGLAILLICMIGAIIYLLVTLSIMGLALYIVTLTLFPKLSLAIAFLLAALVIIFVKKQR